MTEEMARMPLRSPLRYPGGKAFLCEYVEQFLKKNKLAPELFVEPFAGGASTSLHLLGKGLVKNIALCDKDPLVSGFWDTVFNDGDWLRSKVQGADVTIEEWTKQHAKSPKTKRENAWKCLFLNRTSFSGILMTNAGPLGGKTQESDYKVDCRFYRDTVAARLKELWNERKRVVRVEQADWRTTVDWGVQKSNGNQSALIYLDPPFFHKAERLYNFVFNAEEHEAVVKRLAKLKTPWLLSYDDCPEAVDLLRKHGLKYKRIEVRYTSSAKQQRDVRKELVASNLPLPKGIKV
jgi:DNA adenine methylase